MEKVGTMKKTEGIESWVIVYFSALQGGNTEKAEEAKQRLLRLGYQVGAVEAGQ